MTHILLTDCFPLTHRVLDIACSQVAGPCRRMGSAIKSGVGKHTGYIADTGFPDDTYFGHVYILRTRTIVGWTRREGLLTRYLVRIWTTAMWLGSGSAEQTDS